MNQPCKTVLENFGFKNHPPPRERSSAWMEANSARGSPGDGNGIKDGGYGVSGGSYPTPIPHHVIEFCMTVSNRARGKSN